MLHVDADTVIWLPLREADSIAPSDVAGTLDDMAGDTTSTPALTVPSVVDGHIGRARDIETGKGLVADGDDTDLLTRDVTIEVLATLDALTTDGTYTLCCRGKSGSAAERRLYGLQVVVTGAPAAPLYTLQMFWEESTGLQATVPGRPFAMPGGFVMFAATRRWRSATECLVDYVVNGVHIGQVTSIDGDIEGGTAGHFSVGTRGDGSGNYENFWDGPIDHVRVSSAARTPEELRQVYRRIGTHMVQGYEQLVSLMPDDVYSFDPDSVVQRELKSEAAAMSRVEYFVKSLHDDYWPDSGWAHMVDWEKITKLFSKPFDTIEERRARVLSFLRTVHGFSPDQVKRALADVLDLPLTDVQILEYTNLHEDPFTTAAIGEWLAAAGNGTISIDTDRLKLEIATTTDGRFEAANWVRHEMAIDGDVRDSDPSDEADVTVKVDSYSLAQDVMAGVFFYDKISKAIYVYGVYNDAGTNKIGTRHYNVTDGWSAFTADVDPAHATPFWIRAKFKGGTSYEAGASTVGPDSISLSVDATPRTPTPLWCGLGLITFGASPAGASEVLFDDWRGFFPNGLRVFNWHAYRNPALPGTPDIAAAREIVQNIKPAHTLASATSVTELVCDDGDSVCDGGPLG